jgi:pSer/pThr/pTyr-binding forkhead associated (FHA) protein
LVLERQLAQGRLRVGRAPDNELQIDSHYVSRHHCQILTTERMSLIEDVRSTNGLYVNERRVRRSRLANGDVVRLGEHELVYADLRNRSAAPA